VVRRKIRRTKTDSGTEIIASPDKPAITNLLDIYAAAAAAPSRTSRSSTGTRAMATSKRTSVRWSFRP
jgi:hypothetical protein